MKVVKTLKELITAFTEDTPMPASVMKTEGYHNLGFECGCGKWHVNNGQLPELKARVYLRFLYSYYSKPCFISKSSSRGSSIL